jgi:hypothetical protein
MSLITFQLQNIIERNKCNCRVLFATRKCFFQLQTKKVDKYKSKMTFYLNTTTIATTCHFSCKLHTIIVKNCFQLFSTIRWTSSINWAWCHPKILLQFRLGYNYVSSTFGQWFGDVWHTHNVDTWHIHKIQGQWIVKWHMACSQSLESTNN